MSDIIYTIGAETKGVDQASGSMDKLEKSVLDNIRAVERFERDHKKLDRAFNQGRINAQQYSLGHQQLTQQLNQTTSASERQAQAIERSAATMQRGQRVTLATGSAQQALRQRFLETANSIAVLDGPLGGVASRFSAFGVLIGRTGVALATAGVAFTAFSVVMTRGIRDLAEFEVQVSTLENRLNSLSTQVSLTSDQIVRMTNRIALDTLADERELLRASSQILTFGNITTEVFEDVLRSATDMAASGFGTVESAASMLSRALEDPRQSLTSLSRAGITFTRQQRSMIISMIDAGRQGEAMSLILEQVNRQVGGAAEAQARGTMAGQLDTISQAMRLMRQRAAELFVELSRLDRAIEAISSGAEKVVEFLTPDEDEQIKALEARIERITQALEREGISGSFSRLVVRIREVGNPLSDLERRLLSTQHLLNELLEGPERSRTLNIIGQLTSGLENLQDELEVRREVLFLTQEQINVNRALAEAGFGGDFIGDFDKAARDFAESLQRSGVEAGIINRIISDMRSEFEGAKTIVDDFNQTLSDENVSRMALTVLANTREQNDLMAAQILLMREGVDATEARRLAQIEVTQATLQERLENEELTQVQRDNISNALEQLGISEDLLSIIRDITEEDRIRSEMDGMLTKLNDEIALMDAQIEVLLEHTDELGTHISLAEARIEAERRLQSARIETLRIEGQITEEMAEQLQLALQTAAARQEEIGSFEIIRPSRSPRGGGSGGGGGGQSAMQRLMEEIDLQRQRIGLNEEELRLFEARLKVTNAARQDGISLAQEEIDHIAQMIVENEKLIEQQQRLEQARERAAQRMTDLFMAAMQGGESFRRTLANIIQELARMAAMRAFTRVAEQSPFLSAILGFADGGVFRGGNVKAFAKGGIVDGPTMFPMPGVQTGLMGEAGPEAIIPLKRNRKGELGVQGGVTNAVSVTYAPQISVKGSGEEVAELRQEIARMNAEAPARIISTIQKAQKKRVL